MDVASSAYVEQNHSSISTRVEDNRGRSLQATIKDVMGRTEDLFKERKSRREAWVITARKEVENMSKKHRSIYQDARKALQELPYNIFKEAVERSYHYTVSATEDGYLVTYNNDAEVTRFIATGGRCDPRNCKIRQAYLSQCHHELAVRSHLKLRLFEKNHWHKRHLDDNDMWCGLLIDQRSSPSSDACMVYQDNSSDTTIKKYQKTGKNKTIHH